MEIFGFLLLIVWLLVIPTCIGGIPAAFVDKQSKSPAFMCISGYMLMWAVFQLICVPCVLLEEKHRGMFPYVVTGFTAASLILAAAGLVLVWRKNGERKSRKDTHRERKSREEKHSGECIEEKNGARCGIGSIKEPSAKRILTVKEKVLSAVFGALVLLQLVASVVLTYGDGDDAFYVAVSTITEASNTLYTIAPYNIGATGLDIRHGLAPFPIWIAYLARISGSEAAFVAHVAVGTTLIGLTYLIFYKIGQSLWQDKKENLPVFLVFTALLVLFGDYSYHTPENFMIARSRQGKAALGNIIIPMAFLLLLLIFEQIQKKKKAQWMLWVLMCAVVTAACLSSTLGTMLMCLLLGVAGLCAGAVYKNLRVIICMAACCVPAVIYAAMYFLLG